MAGPRRRRRLPRPARHRVEIYLTDAEHQAIRDAAGRPGRGVSVVRFVAEAALIAAGATPPPPTRQRTPSRLAMAEILDTVTAVNRIGNNLNQLARGEEHHRHSPCRHQTEIQRALSALDRLAEVVDSAATRNRR